MAVTTTIRPGPRSTEFEHLLVEIESHPIRTELRGPVTLHSWIPGGPQTYLPSVSRRHGCIHVDFAW